MFKKIILSASLSTCLLITISQNHAMDNISLDETALMTISNTVSQETWDQFSCFSTDENLNNRIRSFLAIHEDFILQTDTRNFQATLENLDYQKALLLSPIPKSQDDQIKRDEEYARSLSHEQNNYSNIDYDNASPWVEDKPISSSVRLNYIGLLNSGNSSNTRCVENFREILDTLQSYQKTPNLNVHTFDNYIFKTQNKMKDLIEFGNLLEIDNPNLTLAQVGQDMNQFRESHPSLFSNFQYFSNQSISSETMKGYLTRHFTNMDTEVAPLCPGAKTMWSKTWTLAKALYEQENDHTAIKIIFEQMCEGYLTQGGCIQGRINRGFVGYVSLLTMCGLK